VPGRVAVVTGAASGIGLGIAQRLADDGDKVALLDVSIDAAEQAAAKLRAAGDAAIAVACDVADRAAVTSAFDKVRAELGPITVLVTSAGIEAFEPAATLSAESWDRLIAINLTGTFSCVQAALGDMLEAGWGRIVTISSSSAQSGAPHMAHYAASKGGVIGLTKALARELASKQITVNTIPPSLVDTPMARGAEAKGLVSVEAMAAHVPLGRAGTPADIAAACAFLCSEEGGYITGQVIGVNGGMYI
jgi:NAD(P)-dependent dehydrogenase (short-subunit alcohol dehydrogenase family)